ARAGPASPVRLVHTQPWPQVVPLEAARAGAEELVRAFSEGVAAFEERYAAYFKQHAGEGIAMRDPAPRVVLVPGAGVVTTGPDAFQASVAAALYERAIAVLSATGGLGGFAPLARSETFDVEYWPMELYKRGLLPPPKELAGPLALVTRGASGLGPTAAQRLAAAGAHVVVADRNQPGAQEVAAGLVQTYGERRGRAVGLDVT